MDAMAMPHDPAARLLSRVPAVTPGFRGIKILATTLGKTGADLVTQQYALGYATGIALFCMALLVLVAVHIRARALQGIAGERLLGTERLPGRCQFRGARGIAPNQCQLAQHHVWTALLAQE